MTTASPARQDTDASEGGMSRHAHRRRGGIAIPVLVLLEVSLPQTLMAHSHWFTLEGDH